MITMSIKKEIPLPHPMRTGNHLRDDILSCNDLVKHDVGNQTNQDIILYGVVLSIQYAIRRLHNSAVF